MKWFARQRIAWIAAEVERRGFINRGHIVNQFDVSLQQASLDLRVFMQLYPDAIIYDKSNKEYRKNCREASKVTRN